ncbi:response regulator [Megalodesulfovibrio gigas]|uniref:Putative two component transcriptional regulator, LuxR family n=1 Tax=Megalodesulfovibrio gigas (strain ATCC 19364 / DSM 1382 / NCIMB 9332 / VKM B-1759) TaxID=1121448 RepID=T2GCI5_MEGG1|nr:response regulator transcription factor [Megalodesulfovibrio gigas]AGW14013.1 putative two component transcriptional regulator, LuxR family [Megalodesulfovibrio gigas DSM 1382 = ATCC 19364]
MSCRRVLLVDDHPLFREGLKALVQQTGQYEVTAEAGSCAEALALARQVRPDIAIVDLSLPDGSGVELLRELQQEVPGLRVVVVSMHCKIEFVSESFRAGAGAYVLKESSAESLARALEAVSRNEQYLDSAVSPKVLQKLMEFSNRRAMISDSPYAKLTRREQQIFRLLAEGVHPADIAASLFISRKTVDNHRANIMSKLGLASTIELVRYAARLGVVDLES